MAGGVISAPRKITDLIGVRAMTHESITANFINRRLQYANGSLYWKKKKTIKRYDNRWNLRYAGVLAGTMGNAGYKIINISNDHGKHMMLEHRLIYLIFHGYMPSQIDHINGITADNRIENLRSIDNSGNRKNSKLIKTNTSGIMGVSWSKVASKWHVYVSDKKKRVNLGHCEDFFEACCVRKSHETKCGYHANHGRK
jgi:hypothetical protein